MSATVSDVVRSVLRAVVEHDPAGCFLASILPYTAHVYVGVLSAYIRISVHAVSTECVRVCIACAFPFSSPFLFENWSKQEDLGVTSLLPPLCARYTYILTL